MSNHNYHPECIPTFRLYAIFIFLFSLTSIIYAQKANDLEGRIFSESGDVAGTHVLNITTQRATIANANGFFSIPVKLNDTLVFSAIQYKRKELPVNQLILESKFLNVYLEEGEIKLDEVFVMPYNLTGDLTKDLDSLHIGPIVTAATLGLPNANVKVKTQNERKLFEADNGKFIRISGVTLDSLLDPNININLNKILNRITGRTQRLRKFVAKDKEIAQLIQIKGYYPDSFFVTELKISKKNIVDFIYFCKGDSLFSSIVKTNDKLKTWEFMRIKSVVYRENNYLD